MYSEKHCDNCGVAMSQSHLHDDAQANRYKRFMDQLNKCRTLGDLQCICRKMAVYACMMSKEQVKALVAHAAARKLEFTSS